MCKERQAYLDIDYNHWYIFAQQCQWVQYPVCSLNSRRLCCKLRWMCR